jgi:hypothetical protein
VDEATMRRYAESSAALITALNPVIGYERRRAGGQAGDGRAADGAGHRAGGGPPRRRAIATLLDPLALHRRRRALGRPPGQAKASVPA